MQLNYISTLFYRNDQSFLHKSVLLACVRKGKASKRRFGIVKAQEVLDFGVAFLIGEHNSLLLRILLFSLGQDRRKVVANLMEVEMNNVCLRCVPEVQLQKETTNLSGIQKAFHRISVDFPLSLQPF